MLFDFLLSLAFYRAEPESRFFVRIRKYVYFLNKISIILFLLLFRKTFLFTGKYNIHDFRHLFFISENFSTIRDFFVELFGRKKRMYVPLRRQTCNN
jgi:hypothetical protein